MFDQSTLDGKVITTALDLAAASGWAEVSLRDVADAAGYSLADVMERFESKRDIVEAFKAAVDRQMLEQAGDVERGQSRRDALFEVIMSRFDAMAPYKAGLKSIASAARRDLPLPDLGELRAGLATQNRILQAAGIDHEGAGQVVRQFGLASLYDQVFRIWLDDDDPGMARTMAALDRRLRQGERTMRFLDDIAEATGRACGQVRTLGERFGEVLRRGRMGGERTAEAAAGAADYPAEADVPPGGNGATGDDGRPAGPGPGVAT